VNLVTRIAVIGERTEENGKYAWERVLHAVQSYPHLNTLHLAALAASGLDAAVAGFADPDPQEPTR